MNVEHIYSGFYHPDCTVIHQDLAAYLDWYGAASAGRGDDPTLGAVGIFFSRHQLLKKTIGGIDALIRELERHGMVPVPLFSQQREHVAGDCPGYSVDIRRLEGVDAIVNCVSSFLVQTDTAGNGATALDLIDVPVFQAVYSSGRTEAEWRANPQGVSAMNQVYWVSQPEFNGTIEPTVLFARDGESAGEYGTPAPVSERIAFFARRLRNWLAMKTLPKSERRVTILLHNNPCHGTEASLGGANGLDTFESVVRLMHRLADEGYHVEDMPADGPALTQLFLDRKAVSEFRWTTIDEIVEKGGVAAMIEPERYEQYFAELSEMNRRHMIESWGEPPGEGMVLDGKIVVTGLQFGNIRVVAEPKRGCFGARCDGDVCRILHDPAVPPTHQCYAAFKWIQEVSDLIISTGTHGYIEFLPGKSCGMTADCFPEIITGEVPHIYIYTSKNPSEAIIAKRRAYAVVADHLIPLMRSAELYDDLAGLDDLLMQYGNASRLGESGRMRLLAGDIRDMAAQHNLLSDRSGHSPEDMSDDEVVEKVHDALFLVRDSTINDGLHILSQTHDADRTAMMLASILKYDGGVPSLRRCILDIRGYEYETVSNGGDTAILDACEKTAVAILTNLIETGRIDEGFIAAQFPGVTFERDKVLRLYALLEWVRDTLHPNLMKTGREIPQILAAMEARYISPGPGGTITRGNTDVLPTGRNIYSIDPRKIPTRAACTVGRKLADEIVQSYLNEEGRYPEKVGMVLWSLDAYRADGEQFAQILYLMGCRPVWNEGGVVTGVEPIPLAELGRPRIDVTVRTSEIFRDTLPNLVELLDRAVTMTANLDESEQDNLILRNVNAYKRTARENGTFEDDRALDRAATFRIFAARPGAYGNGIKLMIAASAWKTVKDLGETFIEHGGYAYGEEVFGRESYGEFVDNLRTVTTVFHKSETDEADPLGCCWNDFQGGMTSAVRALSDTIPKVLWGDTKDPANPRVRELGEEIERVVRAKLLNPQWIEGMKRHGYKGAQDMAHKAESVYSWDATSDVVADWVFDDITRKHILDPEMRDFYEKNNPWALEELARRYLEAERRGLWNADPEVLEGLRNAYLDIEGWMEERMGDVTGEFQGGSVDVMTSDDVGAWSDRLRFDINDYLKKTGVDT